MLFLYVHVVVAADKPQLCKTELSQLVAAVQRTYVQRIVDNGMQQLALSGQTSKLTVLGPPGYRYRRWSHALTEQ